MSDGGISSESKLPNQPPPVPRRPNVGGLLSQSPPLYTPGISFFYLILYL